MTKKQNNWSNRPESKRRDIRLRDKANTGGLPWEVIRRRVIKAAGEQCERVYLDTRKRCEIPGIDVDHIIAGDDIGKEYIDNKGNTRYENLQLLCRSCHLEKTEKENAARKGKVIIVKKKEEKRKVF